MDKNFLKVGLPVLVKKSYVKNHPHEFDENKTYYIVSVHGSRAFLSDLPENGRNVGSVTASNLELSSRQGMAINLEVQASKLLESVKALQVKAERLKRFGSDDEEIAYMIENSITEKKLSPLETIYFLRENGVEIKFKKGVL